MVLSRRRIVNDSDEESVPNKRIRLEESSFEAFQSSDEEGNENSSEEDTPLPTDNDGYVEGSIVKITLRNFVTYDYCEFSPGPQLNMIIGPNGTGKSTIVCAVALGLGGAPSLLGRAKNISEFVKTGEDEAVIQIELKRTNGERNVIIQRNITKSNNASTWRMNGRLKPQKEVLAIVNQLNIQVDNLCQFLPQDKVAEFAQLTPPALLEKTQEAAGATDLLKWHQDLIEWKKEEKNKTRSYEEQVDELKTKQTQNANLERDVMRMRQREEILRRIKILQAKLPLVKYTDAKNIYDQAKAVQQEKLAILERLREENQPIEEAKQEYIAAVRKAQIKTDGLNAKYQELKQKINRIKNEFDTSDNETKTIEGKIRNIERHREKRLQDIKNLEDQIERLTNTLGDEPSLDGLDELSAAMEIINRKMGDLELELHQFHEQFQINMRQQHAIKGEINSKEKELSGLNDTFKLRFNKLQQHQGDTCIAYQWLQNNRHKFTGKIYGPVILQLHLKDERYANMVETLLGGRNSSNLKAFICERKEDYMIFTKEVVDNQGLRVTVAWPDEIDQNSIKVPMTKEQLREKHGMDYFLSELLEGPKIIIDYLCSTSRINLVPLSLRNVDEKQVADSSDFRRFAINDISYEVKRYTYGRGGNQVQTRKCWISEFLKNKIDNQALSKIKREIHDLDESLKELQMEHESIGNNRNRIKQKLAELRHEKEDKKAQKHNIQLTKNRWEKGKYKIEATEVELQTLRQTPADHSDAIDQFKLQLENQVSRRANLAERYGTIVKDATECILERNVAELEKIQAIAKRTFVEEFSRRQSTALNHAEQGYRYAQAEANQKKSVAQRYQRDVNSAGSELRDDPSLLEEFETILSKWRTEGGLDQTALEVEDAIQGEQAKAEALKAANPRAMELYDERLVIIQNLQRSMEVQKQELDGLREKIENTKTRWEPQLEALVKRISDSFGVALQRIGCAGEVQVAKDEDFDKWGIEIRVKFRDNEKLQLLTGQRQSGGERAVSTILYLMSLQSLAKSPFRVVDEINQGMDPRNERMIHEQIVKGASKPGTAQYFLITPKLLPDLFYNERMRVLCIYNGEWQPTRLKPISEYLSRAGAPSSSSSSSSSRPITSAIS